MLCGLSIPQNHTALWSPFDWSGQVLLSEVLETDPRVYLGWFSGSSRAERWVSFSGWSICSAVLLYFFLASFPLYQPHCCYLVRYPVEFFKRPFFLWCPYLGYSMFAQFWHTLSSVPFFVISLSIWFILPSWLQFNFSTFGFALCAFSVCVQVPGWGSLSLFLL